MNEAEYWNNYNYDQDKDKESTTENKDENEHFENSKNNYLHSTFIIKIKIFLGSDPYPFTISLYRPITRITHRHPIYNN